MAKAAKPNQEDPPPSYFVKTDDITSEYLAVRKTKVKGEIYRYGMGVNLVIPNGMTLENEFIQWKHHLEAYKYWTTKDMTHPNRCYYHFKEAFKWLWPNFIWHHGFEMEMQLWCSNRNMTIIGATRQSKTYGMAHILFLDWLADPAPIWKTVTNNGVKSKIEEGGTRTTVATAVLERLRSTLGRDIIASTERCRSDMSEMFSQILITTNTTAGFSIIMAPDKSMTKAQNDTRKTYGIFGLGVHGASEQKIQGVHCERRRMIYDEAVSAPDEYFSAEKNNISNADDYKGVHMANPTDKHCSFGMMCKPSDGWDSITMNTEFWRAKGRSVLRLDAFKSFNFTLHEEYKAGKIDKAEYDRRKFSWMLDPSSQDFIDTYDENTAPYFTMVRAWFLADGMVHKVFSSYSIEQMDGDYDFDFKPTHFAVNDPAIMSDDCVLHHGLFGKGRDGRIHIHWIETVKIETNPDDRKTSREKQIGMRIINKLDLWGVDPKHYIMDISGNGRAILSPIQDYRDHPERMNVQGVDFGGKATDRPMYQGDIKVANELVVEFVDELWFRADRWAKAGVVHGLNNLHNNTITDLNSREYYMKGNRMRLYPKDVVKKEIGRSPDFGDSFILFAELMTRLGHVPTAKHAEENPVDASLEFSKESRETAAAWDKAATYQEEYY